MTLEDDIITVLSDGRGYNVRWIAHKLERLGVSVTTARIRMACEKMNAEGKLVVDFQNNRHKEWRLA